VHGDRIIVVGLTGLLAKRNQGFVSIDIVFLFKNA
jgi:hypothetical protein